MTTSTRAASSYRRPRNPGFAGSWNLWPALASMVCFVVGNWAATQWIARRFEFQTDLGAPMRMIGATPLYPPFEWIRWLATFGSDTRRFVRQSFEGAIGIVAAAICLTFFLYMLLALRRSRALSKDQEDLHGSARFQNLTEIKSSGLINRGHGVYVGAYPDVQTKTIHYLKHNGPEHVLAFAPTRSGKGISLVIPTLLSWHESSFVYDIKGENWAASAGFQHAMGHTCLHFSPVALVPRARFNPLAEIRIFTPRDVADAQNMAHILIRNGSQETSSDPHWKDAAIGLVTGLILHVCYAAAANGRTATLGELSDLFTDSPQGLKAMLTELTSYPHDPQHRQQWRDRGGRSTSTHPAVRRRAQSMIDKEDKEFSGIQSSAETALLLYNDPLLTRNLETSDFCIDDLVNAEVPLAVYYVVPEADRIRLTPLTRLIFTLIVNRLTEGKVADGAVLARRHRLLLMIDEFPTLKNMELFADALSYMAGYGIKVFLIAQDIRQIIAQYGPHESIVTNCHIRIAFGPNQLETAELLSKLAGAQTIPKASYNFSGSRFSVLLRHVTASVEHVERPLLTPAEVMLLAPAKKAGEGAAERIVAPGESLIFIQGQRPIRGQQLLYFQDPILLARARIRAPDESWTIRGGVAESTVDRLAQLPVPTEEIPPPLDSIEEDPSMDEEPADSSVEYVLERNPRDPRDDHSRSR